MAASAPSAARQRASGGLAGLTRYSDIVLAVAVAAIVGMMIIPLPEPLLDVLITLNIAGALVMLLVAIYTQEPLQFSVFPSLLLIATLFRLALNVSASRLILLQAHAGEVIAAFGQFVVGGNYVVGVVVFLILIVIQFAVITHGAGRVAEVAARFTLDAMPGKQMAIDADLNAGLINEDEARRRRKAVEQEADFYGAMDGASKFVKGDAIAGVVIILVNIIGGVIVGVVQLRMGVEQALQTYTLLTVGDGLVSQIPAILLSTATGIIVTRASSDSNLGRDAVRQVLASPRALAVVAALLVALALVPGLPKLPFLVLAALLGAAAYALRRGDLAGLAGQLQPAPASAGAPGRAGAAAAEAGESDSLAKFLHLDPIEVEIGYGLIALADEDQGGNLLSRITLIRRQMALDLGIILPTIRIRDNLQLGPNQYVFKLRGVTVAQGEVRLDRLLAMNPGAAEKSVPGIPTTEPAFGLPALWIQPEDRERAELLGWTVVDAASVITTHLTEVLRANAPSLLTRQDVQRLLDGVKAEQPAAVQDVVPDLLSLGDVQRVLQNLLRERVSVRDLPTILEALANHARLTKDPDQLTEHARQALGRAITAQLAAEGGHLYVITLAPSWQQQVAAALQPTEQGVMVALEPSVGQRLLQSLGRAMEKLATAGHQPVLLVPGRIRLPLRRYCERALPTLAVLSYAEVPPQLTVHTLAVVGGPEEP